MSRPYRYYIDDGRLNRADNATIVTTPATVEYMCDKNDGFYECTAVEVEPEVQTVVYKHHIDSTWCETLEQAIEWITFTMNYGIYTAVRCGDNLLVMPYRWHRRYNSFGAVKKVAPHVGCITLTDPRHTANRAYIQNLSGVPADVAGAIADNISGYIQDPTDETINIAVHAVYEPTKLLLYAVITNSVKLAALAMRMGANANYAVYKITANTSVKLFSLVYQNCCVTGKHYLISRMASLSMSHPVARWLLKHKVVSSWPVNGNEYFQYDGEDWRSYHTIVGIEPTSLFEYVHNYEGMDLNLLLQFKTW